MEAIKNERTTELVPYSVPDAIVEVDTDFIEATDLETLEEGIRNLGKAQDILALAQGVAIVKIESEGYWIQGGFPNLRAYRIAQAERLNMPLSTVSLRRRCAEAWLKYGKALMKLDLTGKVSFLPYFDQAVQVHGIKESVAKLKDMSFREFKSWVDPLSIDDDGERWPEVDFSIRRGDIVIDGLTVATLKADIPENEKDFFASLLKKGYAARKGNMIPLVLPVYDQGEARAMENALKKYRSNK